jgi:hypothetical protein
MTIGQEKALYTYKVYDQMGLLCYRLESWHRIEPSWFNAFLILGNAIVLDRIEITGQDEDGTSYRRYGNEWKRDHQLPEPAKGLKLVGEAPKAK